MGCNSSKAVDAGSVVGIYRPAPTSFAVFDINSIEEPWLKLDQAQLLQCQEKPSQVPTPVLEKLKTFEVVSDSPRTWDEVSKALEDLKPILRGSVPTARPPAPPHEGIRKSLSFHTLEELDAKLTSKPTEPNSAKAEPKNLEPRETVTPAAVAEGFKPLRENMFIVRDMLERKKVKKASAFDAMMSKRDPLSQYPEKCPPGGADAVVLYTTSLRGVRRTCEDCARLRVALEGHGVVVDERDVALHGEFLSELRALVGEDASVPRLFVKGRYLGGAEEVAELDESGRLGRLLGWAGVEKGVGRRGCEGCGGARFVPCLECGGSCKVLRDGKSEKERCLKCNENGLVHCPACF